MTFGLRKCDRCGKVYDAKDAGCPECGSKLFKWVDKKKEEKTMVDIERIIKLRDQMRKAIKIQKEDEGRYQEGTPAHSYHLGGLHRLEEFESKINDLIILG